MLTLIALTAQLSHAHIPQIYITNAGVDWCSVIATAKGGDTVMFEPGTYTGPCDVEARLDDKGETLTILQAFDTDDPPLFTPGPEDDYVFRVWGERLVMLEMQFTGGTEDTTMILADGIDGLWLRWNQMRDVPGTGLRFEGDIQEIHVVNSTFERVPHPVDLSCDKDCTLGRYVIDNSLFVEPVTAVRVTEPAPGEVRDVVVFGATDAAVHVTVGHGPTVQNVMLDARGDALRLQQPSSIQNAVLIGDDAALRYDQPLASVVEIAGSTVLGPIEPATAAATNLQLVGNALDRPPPSATDRGGNVVCADLDTCFTDPSAFDFLPVAQGPLVDAGGGTLTTDWCNNPRDSTPDAGAFETREDHASKGGIPMGLKDLWDCSFPRQNPFPDTGDTGDTAVDTGVADDPSGCGCQQPPAVGVTSWGILWMLCAVGLLRSRRPGPQPRPAPGVASRTR